MHSLSDTALLEAYARDRCDDAFRELVSRHMAVVYSAAMRQWRDPHLAQEATQAAFVALAARAGNLPPRTVIAGWLHRAVHFAGLNLIRGTARRRRWEQEAGRMNPPDTPNPDPTLADEALPHIDAAMAELNEADRDALVLRFLQSKGLRDVAQALGTSEEAAKKRVHRALDRLREVLVRRGVVLPSVALSAGLEHLPVHAAPAGLADAITTLAAAHPPAAGAGAFAGFLTPLAIVSVLVVTVVGILVLQRSPSPIPHPHPAMRILLATILVDDSDQALAFYTGPLGFRELPETPTGLLRGHALASPAGRPDQVLLLVPADTPAARAFQSGIFESLIPATSFASTDVEGEHRRLTTLGVPFTSPPAAMGPTVLATFRDTCGNLVQLHQHPNPSRTGPGPSIRVHLASVFVDNQEQALRFYTESLGLTVKHDLPLGEFRWITLTSPSDPDGMELLLEPNAHPAARAWQQALRNQTLPALTLNVDDLDATHRLLTDRGVRFPMAPAPAGPSRVALLEDPSGNLIQLLQP